MDYFQDEVQSYHRSTAWSFKKLISTSVIAIVSPIVGYMADHYDHKTAIFALTGLMATMWCFVFISHLLRNKKALIETEHTDSLGKIFTR